MDGAGRSIGRDIGGGDERIGAGAGAGIARSARPAPRSPRSGRSCARAATGIRADAPNAAARTAETLLFKTDLVAMIPAPVLWRRDSFGAPDMPGL